MLLLVFIGVIVPATSAIGSILFEISGRKTTAPIINFWKMVFGITTLSVLLYFLGNDIIPNMPPIALLASLVSAILGFAICDYFLISAFILVGSRITNLVLSLAPIFTGIVGHFFIDDSLTLQQWLGIITAVIGVGIVIKFSSNSSAERDFLTYKKGVLYAAIAMVTLGLGLIAAKVAMNHSEPTDVILMRSWIGLLLFAMTLVITRQVRQSFDVVKDHSLFQSTFWGSMMLVTVATPLAIMVSSTYPAAVGVAFIAITPLMIIPLSVIIMKEKVKKADIIGTIICFAGIVVLIT